METKLATIVCSDVIGYSRQMQSNELETLKKLDECRAIIDPLINSSKGRLFNTGGDSVLIEFNSAVEAVRFSVEMQNRMYKLNNGLRWRIGMHVGEVWIYGTNLMGEAVNLAARTESLADYGGVTMTKAVYNLVSGKIKDYKFISRGVQEFKNVMPMEIFSIVLEGAEANPNLNKTIKQENKQATKSHKELVANIINDTAARNRSLNDAQSFKRDENYGPAVRILLWRITKNDKLAVDEIINMGLRNVIPSEFNPYVNAILKEFCMKVDCDRLLKIADLMEKLQYKSSAFQFVKEAAKFDEVAQHKYAVMILDDPNSSQQEINSILDDLKEIAMNKKVSAMMKLGDFYLKLNDKKNAFRWFYAARSEHSQDAQKRLEELNKTLSKAEFQNYKTDADALVDQIKFIYDNKMRN